MKTFAKIAIFPLVLASAIGAQASSPDIEAPADIIAHSRYVLQDEKLTDINIYLFAANEKDFLCSGPGGKCVLANDHYVEGSYKLIAIKDAGTSNATAVYILDIGSKSFKIGSAHDGVLGLFEVPGSPDKIFTLTEAANSIGDPSTSFFRLSAENRIEPVSFFLKDGNQWTDIGSPRINGEHVVITTSYAKAPPDKDYLDKLPAKFDYGTMTLTLPFIYKNGNFHITD